MADVASAPDPGLVEEIRFVERVRAHFKGGGVQLAFWEAYCLSQASRAALGRAVDRTPPELPTEILESLRVLRDRGGPIVGKLRQFFLTRPRSPAETDLQEMSLAVLVGSERGREAVGRWVNDPARHAQEAVGRIRGIMERLDAVRRTLHPEAAPLQLEPPGVPEGLAATPGPRRVALAWTPVPGASGYAVKRSGETGTPFVPIATPAGNSHVDEHAGYRRDRLQRLRGR